MAARNLKNIDIQSLATKLAGAFGGGVLSEMRSVRKNKKTGKDEFVHTVPRLPMLGFGGTYGPLLMIGGELLPVKYRLASKILSDIGEGLVMGAVSDMGQKLMVKAQLETAKKVPIPKPKVKASGDEVDSFYNGLYPDPVGIAGELTPGILGDEEVVATESEMLGEGPQLIPLAAAPMPTSMVPAESTLGYGQSWVTEAYPDASFYGLQG